MRALIQSGGGAKGAFELGVLDVLVAAGRDYDYLAGVSVGALNTAVLSQAPKGKLGVGLAKLEQLWRGITSNRSVYRSWPFWGRLAGLWKDSFYDSSPLAELVKEHLDEGAIRSSGRILRIGTVAMGTGEYREVGEAEPELWRWVLASAAFPAFFTPMALDGDLWLDGGIRRITPLSGAIEAGCDHIDVILASPRRSKAASLGDNWSGTKRSALTLGLRAIELMSDELFARDLKVTELYNKLAASGHDDKRHVELTIFEPEEPLMEGSSLEFDPKRIEVMREKGRAVATARLGR